MKCYRIKHLPTGLYYRPSSEVMIKCGDRKIYVKTNLSKKGKIYSTKPSESWFVGKIYNHLQTQANIEAAGITTPSYLSDRICWKTVEAPREVWEIEEL